MDKDRLKERLLNHHYDANGASGYLDCPQPNILRSKSAENLNVEGATKQRRHSHSQAGKGAKHDRHHKHEKHHHGNNHHSNSHHGSNHLNGGGSYHGGRRHSHTPQLGMLDAFSDHDPSSTHRSFQNVHAGSHMGINTLPADSDSWSRRSSGNASMEGMTPLLRKYQ